MSLRQKERQTRPFLDRLARDTSGNTMFLIAASLAPILAMIGGGIDISRGYLAETRLQQACDAGVLAARKKLGSSAVVDGTIPADVATTGQRFFDINFGDGAYGSRDRNFAMTLEADYSITGKASVAMPTAVMMVFGYDQMAVSSTCQARLNFSNTDIMMVLDTTGSMNTINPGDVLPRIDGLKNTIVSFYTQLMAAKLGGSRIRFGFVPYSTNVNVGHLLQSDWVVDDWSYQTRTAGGALQWRYTPRSFDVSFLKGASGSDLLGTGSIVTNFGGTAMLPANMAAPFNGCIEERSTYEIGDYDNVDLGRALDLDLDRLPDPADPDTQWRPQFPRLIFDRAIKWDGSGSWQKPVINTGDEYVAPDVAGFAACPPRAQKMAELSLSQLTTFLGTLVPRGSTYHDIGMIWGGRLLSPTGIFASENADLSEANPSSRNLIFLTDGETAPLDLSYSSYGVEPVDNRRWRPSSPLSLRETVEKRFAVACKEVKKRNIAVWFVAFGTSVNPVMAECAGPGHYFGAANTDELNAAFAKIAQNIGDLRIVR